MVFRVLEHVLGDTDYSTIEELAQDPESLLSNMPAIADVLDNFGELIDMDLDEVGIALPLRLLHGNHGGH